jgi:hypothetical protein
MKRECMLDWGKEGGLSEEVGIQDVSKRKTGIEQEVRQWWVPRKGQKQGNSTKLMGLTWSPCFHLSPSQNLCSA